MHNLPHTPTNHVRNLGEKLGTNDTTPTPPTSSDLPPPPPNHPILILSNAFKNAIRENRIYALKSLSKQFIHQLDTNLEFFAYDHSDLATCYQTAEDIINAHTTVAAEPPPSQSTSILVLVSNLLNKLLIYTRILTFSR